MYNVIYLFDYTAKYITAGYQNQSLSTRVTHLGKPNFIILVGDIYKLVSIPKMHQAPKASFLIQLNRPPSCN